MAPVAPASLPRARCATQGCPFYADRRRRFGPYCCGACIEGFHGIKCEKDRGVVPTIRANLACASPMCPYMVHSWPELGGFCCKACADCEDGHGVRCEGVLACWGSVKAALSDLPRPGRDLQKLDMARSGAASKSSPGAADKTPLAGRAPKQTDAAKGVAAADPLGKEPECRLPAKPGRIWEVLSAITLEDGGHLEPGALLVELTRERDSMRFTLMAGDGPSEGWVPLPALEARRALVAAGTEGSAAAKEAAEVERARQQSGSDAPMVWIVSQGTRGDLQPVLAVGVALRKAGFRVRIFASANLQTFVESHGLLFTEMGVDLKDEFLRFINGSPYKECKPSESVQLYQEGLKNDDGGDRIGEKWVRECTRVLYSVLKQEQPSVVFCCGLMGDSVVPFLAWRRNKAVVCKLDFCPFPAKMTEETFEPQKLVSQVVLEETRINPLGGCTPETYNRWLADHRAIVCTESAVDVFLSYADADDTEKELLRRACVGFCVLDQTQQMVNLDEFGGGETLCRVVAYLDAGEKPVYLGWGSMPVHVGFLMKSVVAFKATSTRAIICAGWGKMTLEALKDYAARLPGDHADVVRYAEQQLLFVGAVPHEWLFPRCACTIHHGGAGTTCAAVRAGVPTIITPFAHDQPSWAAWVSSIGVGMSLSLREDADLVEDPAWIEAVKRATTDKKMLARAKAWSRKLRHDDGPSRMVTFVRRVIELSQGANASSVDEAGKPRFGW